MHQPGWQLLDPREERALGGHVADAHVGVEHLQVDRWALLRGAARSALISEAKAMPSARHGVVERLDAQAVAGEKQALRRPVPDREGEHAVELVEQASPSLLVEAEDDLGVGLGAGSVWPRASSSRAQLEEVVDLAVEGDGELAVLGEHRLAPAPGEVEDGQPLVGEPQRALVEEALVVRPAVGEAGRPWPAARSVDRPPRAEVVDARDAAHDDSSQMDPACPDGPVPGRKSEAKNGPLPQLTPVVKLATKNDRVCPARSVTEEFTWIW